MTYPAEEYAKSLKGICQNIYYGNRYKCILQLLGFGETCLALEEKSSEVVRVFTIDSKNMFKFNEIWSLCPEFIAI